MESIFFYSDRELSDHHLLEVMKSVASVTALTWTPGFLDLEDVDKNILYGERSLTKGQFPFIYEIRTYHQSVALNRREKIELLQSLARMEDANILTYDDDINPYIFIHINPQGETCTMAVVTEDYDQLEELTIDEVYNHCFGGFALETSLPEVERAVLDEQLQSMVPLYELVHVADGPVKVSFGMHKDGFDSLKNMIHHYFVMPTGKNMWRSKDEKSELLATIMNSFHQQTKRKVCFFPANSTDVQNIPGGSDSESFCILLDQGESTKIVYKPRRKSWLTGDE